MGVRVWVRGVRKGASSYRAAMMCRADSPLTIDALQGTRASWCDRDSVGGYLLPLALLRNKGLDPNKLFASQTFSGSYQASLDALLHDAPNRASRTPRTSSINAINAVGSSTGTPHDTVASCPANDTLRPTRSAASSAARTRRSRSRSMFETLAHIATSTSATNAPTAVRINATRRRPEEPGTDEPGTEEPATDESRTDE